MKKIMHDKKGVELALSTIVVAVLALIVLIVIVFVFVGKIKETGEGTTEVTKQFDADKCVIPGTDRTCRLSKDMCESKGGIVYAGTDCPGVCCSV
jgi:hypothetical protein